MEILNITPVKYEGDNLMILDQTRLPGESVLGILYPPYEESIRKLFED